MPDPGCHACTPPQRYEEPTVLLAKRVTGEEEVPEGVVAVVTPDAPDVLSHVSVRARNMRVFFGVCHEPEPLAQIEALAGKVRPAWAPPLRLRAQTPLCHNSLRSMHAMHLLYNLFLLTSMMVPCGILLSKQLAAGAWARMRRACARQVAGKMAWAADLC